MRRAAAIASILAFTASSAAASEAALPGARSIKVCAAAGPFWPTMTLALRGTTAWVACKTQSRVIRVNTRTGKTTKSVRLRGPAIAVASAFGSIWALDSGGTLYRVKPTGRVTKRIALDVAAAYTSGSAAGLSGSRPTRERASSASRRRPTGSSHASRRATAPPAWHSTAAPPGW